MGITPPTNATPAAALTRYVDLIRDFEELPTILIFEMLRSV